MRANNSTKEEQDLELIYEKLTWGKKPDAEDVSDQEATQAIKSRIGAIKEEDVRAVVDREHELEAMVKGKGPLGQYWDDIKTLMAMIKAYAKGEYKEIPWLSVAAITVTLIYVLTPTDLIPDVIPVVGIIDDAAVVGMCIKMVRSDIDTFRQSTQGA